MQQGSARGFSLCQNVWSWLLCCNDTSADLLLQGLDVDTVLEDGKYYFWTSLCVLQRVCITQGRGSLHPDTVWVELPQWVFWSGFIGPENCRWNILWSQAVPVGSAVWSLVIYKEKTNRNSSCITGFSNAHVKLSSVRLARCFLPAGVDFPSFPSTLSSCLVVQVCCAFLRTSPDLDWKAVFLPCTV